VASAVLSASDSTSAPRAASFCADDTVATPGGQLKENRAALVDTIKRNYTRRSNFEMLFAESQPLGMVGVIVSWNFPLPCSRRSLSQDHALLAV
jgi:hypothetical protein